NGDCVGNAISTNIVVADGNVIVEDRPPPPVVVSPAPRRDNAASRLAPAAEQPWATAALLSGLALILLLAALALALTLRRMGRARTVKRTRAMLGVSPSLDLAEGRCEGDDLSAEGPAASLRTRLDPGAAHMEEGDEHG
ncbi:MAG TPA: hypothetical protein VEW26_10260, partial [Allosphingosinicella sp.]|nr:hypothetical protein [Allosphingosinicella sp.]